MTDRDKWSDEHIDSWQKIIGKPFIKDATSEAPLPDLNERVTPGATPRPISIGGLWNNGSVKIKQDNRKVTGTYIRGNQNDTGGFSGSFDGLKFDGDWESSEVDDEGSITFSLVEANEIRKASIIPKPTTGRRKSIGSGWPSPAPDGGVVPPPPVPLPASRDGGGRSCAATGRSL